MPRSTIEDEVISYVQVELEKIEPELVRVVEELTRPLFMVYSFFELSHKVYEEIIKDFTAGRQS